MEKGTRFPDAVDIAVLAVMWQTNWHSVDVFLCQSVCYQYPEVRIGLSMKMMTLVALPKAASTHSRNFKYSFL